jgi:arylsulfatase A-like enzyme
VRSLPAPSAAQRAAWLDDRARADEALLAADDALRAIVAALGDRIEETVIFVLSDNGFSFGEHRWRGKECPYEACIRIPLAVHTPVGDVDTRDAIVSTIDIAPTVLSLVRVPRPDTMDGVDFADRIMDRPGIPIRPPEAVYLEWAGDADIPAWTAVRTPDLKLIRYADGFEELYDIGGRIEAPDPWETVNRARDVRYAGLLERLRALLGQHLGPR